MINYAVAIKKRDVKKKDEKNAIQKLNKKEKEKLITKKEKKKTHVPFFL